jgi:hypothetical protein
MSAASHARKNLAHSPLTRERIKTSMIVNRLQDHVEGKVELSPTQVSAGLGLLKKTLPDLQATTISGDQENPLRVAPDLSKLAPDQLRLLASIPLTGE